VTDPSLPPEPDRFGERLIAAADDGGERDPEAEKWRSDLAARLFGGEQREVMIGRYAVLSKVGNGATGVVFAALEPQLDRKVALKVLRPDVSLPPGRAAQWLAREAKILARLSHPNVVPVYDVGEDEGRLFIALELVEGRSLRPWMQEPHTWPEVLEVFVQAGRGLAAAHAAGLVHRDFKPENVLLGDDGRVRVSDFGIARRLASEEPAHPETRVTRDGPDAQVSLTTHGGGGTPSYMAPEQFLGDSVDARTDLFGFCVSLHEALYGERPFAGDTTTGLAANVIAGRRLPGSPKSGVPKWLDTVVARGLEIDPEHRHPSMEALLAILERRRGGRKRWLLGVAFVAGLGGAAALNLGEGDLSPCDGGRAKLAAVWNPPRALEIEAAFRTTRVPHAEDSARRVREAVDEYGRTWVETYALVCEGASQEAVVQRMYCLQSRLLELTSLADLFEEADERVVEHAVASTSALVAPDECLYVGATASTDQEDLGSESAELRLVIARAKVLGDTGQPREARRQARAAAQQARDRMDRTLEAEALIVAARVERGLLGVVESNDAELTAYSAVLAAEAAHRPDLLARALVEYLSVTVSLGRREQAGRWEQRARDAVEAIGSPSVLVGRIEYAMALASSFAGQRERSQVAAERALAHFRQGGTATRRWMSTAENLLGELEFESGRYATALPHYERALDIAIEELGPDHAWVASAHGNMAEVFFLSGRYAEAREHFTLALEIREGAYGPTSVWVLHTLAHLGDVALVLDEPERALGLYRRALGGRAQLRRMAGDRPEGDDQMLSVYRDLQAWDQEQWLHHGVALALLRLHLPSEARAEVELVPEPRIPADHHHPDLISRLDVPGQVELAEGAWTAAIGEFERALDRMEAELGPDHRYLVHPLLGLGQAHLGRGAPEEARPFLQRGVRIIEVLAPQIEPRVRASLRIALAQSLEAQPGATDAK